MIASLIDHTLLKADCSTDEIQTLCREAQQYGFAAVCVPPYFVREVRQKLGEYTPIKLATVIGFPMGYVCISAKIEEIKRAVMEEVDEMDIVINIAAIKSGHWNQVKNDIDATVRAVHLHGKIVKLIIETSLLTEDEIKRICDIAVPLETNFIKTSTGYNGGSVSPDVIRFLRAYLPKQIKIKASGGIRTLQAAQALAEAGAVRLGCSASVQIAEEEKKHHSTH